MWQKLRMKVLYNGFPEILGRALCPYLHRLWRGYDGQQWIVVVAQHSYLWWRWWWSRTFVSEVLQPGNKIQSHYHNYKHFFRKKWCNVITFWGICFLEVAMLKTKWCARSQNIAWFLNFSAFSTRFSQIWLSPLVDACQPTYLTNLKKEKHWLACSPSNYTWGFSAIIGDGFGYSSFQGLLLH